MSGSNVGLAERAARITGAWIFGLGIWQCVALLVRETRGVPFPTPLECFLVLKSLLSGAIFLDHSVYHHVRVSGLRWAEGFVVGTGCGLVYAFFGGGLKIFRQVTMPTVEVLQIIPGLAWVPVAILIFGLNQAATVAMIAVTTFPVIAISGVMGVRSLDARYIRAAKMCGAGAFNLFFTVYLPGALPHFFSGIRIALGASFRVLVAAEMIVGSGDGLGYAIIQSRWTLDYVSAFVCIAIIAVIGLSLERLALAPLERKTIQRWGMGHER